MQNLDAFNKNMRIFNRDNKICSHVSNSLINNKLGHIKAISHHPLFVIIQGSLALSNCSA